MEIRQAGLSFGSRELFQNLSLRIDPGQFTLLLGPSGCGKSTLLRIFAGLQKLTQGFCEPLQARASFVFQDANLLPWRTIQKNIMLPLEISKAEFDEVYFQSLTEMLKISDLLHRYPHEISGGQKMRVSIGRALITKPKILFMDEPFSALDEPTRFALQEQIKQIQKRFQISVLFVTHSFYEAVFLADRLIILSKNAPTKVILDQVYEFSFSERFDSKYQDEVQKITSLFGQGNPSV